MIIINENRRAWELNHKVVAVSDNEIKVIVDGIEEIINVEAIDNNEAYTIEDCIYLPYNPIQSIIKSNDVITVTVFYDDPYKRGIEPAFKRQKTSLKYIVTVDDEKIKAKETISALAVERNYSLLPQYKRDNIYAGEEACEGYPDYLRGEAGKHTIAKMNRFFRDKVKEINTSISEALTKADVKVITENDHFPKSGEEMISIIQIM